MEDGLGFNLGKNRGDGIAATDVFLKEGGFGVEIFFATGSEGIDDANLVSERD